ncbi:CU044_5270 family protein [Nonomuraea sp. NN258]|uniref:CU044_5270 family protein n=1 Tax=Nonomuraea antri TaxID=2730852 RepID=UPI0015688A88|nr:CU044_5270 family protein [Nonomuraea antri]NRQ32550.1 CU044_5270 family protein [Nonomuraea antri]
MDELDALRRMRTSSAREETPDLLARRIDWRSATRPRPRPSPRRSLRLSLRLPAIGLVATAAVVAAAAIAVSLPQDRPDRPGRPGGGGKPYEPGNVLLVAASNVRTAATGAYWYTTRVAGKVYAVGQNRATHYKVESRMRYHQWTERDGRACSAAQDLPARPWSDRDRARWRQAGAPMKVRVPTPEGPGTVFMDAPDRRLTCRNTGDQRFYGMTPERIAALPTDPERLKDALLDLEGDWAAYAPKVSERPIRSLRGAEQVRALSDVAGTLLSTAPTPPAVRAAAFRMLAALPGVTAGGATTDPLGRSGVVISLPLETTLPLGLFTAPKQLGTYRRQWIVDPAKGTLLAIRDLMATPPRGSRELPPGDDGRPRRLTPAGQPDRFHRPGEVSEYETYEIAEWTDTPPPR